VYAWIWRRLPFGLPGKLAGSVLLVTAVAALLWYVVFPWAEPWLPPYDDAQIPQDGGGGPGVPTADPSGGGEPGDGHDLPYSTEQPE